jgi:hypothetical protein
MKSMRIFFLIVVLLCCGVLSLYSQSPGDYRTAQSGNWNETSSWQRYSGGVWGASSFIPDSASGKIQILAGHTVTVTSNIVVDSLFIDSLGTLIVPAGDTVTVGPPNLAAGTSSAGISVHGGGSLLMSGTYKHARDGGSYVRATWLPGSTCLVSPGAITLTTVPGNRNQSFQNFEWNCPNQTGNLSLNMTGTEDTIKGNFVVRATGASGRIYLTAPGTTAQIYTGPINILGDFILYNGQFGSNGSSSSLQGGLTHYEINIHGNLIVNGSGSTTSWFALGRGSAFPAVFKVYGNVSFSACSLTTSNNADAKIMFVKNGIQTLTLSDVTVGSSSAFSYEVANGSTVDIGTSALTGNGTFVVDSGGALKVTYGTSTGSIAYTGSANTVAYNNFAIATAVTGSGSATFAAATPANANLSDPTKSMPRYYTVTADAGITAATVAINYPVTEVPATVTEANLIMAKYSGTGKIWSALGPVTDATNHIATSNTGVNINGVWTLCDPSLIPTDVSTFEASITSIDFGTVEVGQVKKDSVIVTNHGTVDLIITAVTSSNSVFAVTPTTATVGKDASQKFYITFEPTANGVQYGKVAFTHNALTNDTLTVTGNGHLVSVGNTNTMIPDVYQLHNNYPNPFNPTTTIQYDLPKQSIVTLKVYSLLGQEVATLVNDNQGAGYHQVVWTGQNNVGKQVASGIYIVRIYAKSLGQDNETFTQIKKMVLLK